MATTATHKPPLPEMDRYYDEVYRKLVELRGVERLSKKNKFTYITQPFERTRTLDKRAQTLIITAMELELQTHCRVEVKIYKEDCHEPFVVYSSGLQRKDADDTQRAPQADITETNNVENPAEPDVQFTATDVSATPRNLNEPQQNTKSSKIIGNPQKKQKLNQHQSDTTQIEMKTENEIENESEFENYEMEIEDNITAEDKIHSLNSGVVTNDSEASLKCKDCDCLFDAISLIDHRHSNCPKIQQWKCDFCSKVFTNRERLNSHKNETHICLICSSFTDSVAEMRTHIETIHFPKKNSGPRSCRICDFFVTQASEVQHHEHTDLHKLSCDYCPNETFNSLPELVRHCQHAHTEWALFECPTCNDWFPSEKCFQLHCKLHAPEFAGNPKTKAKLNDSLNTNENSQLAPEMWFDEKDSQETEQSFKNVQYDCFVCDKVFMGRTLFGRHLSRLHKDKSVFKCPQCDQRFNLPVWFLKHSKSHEKEAEIYPCNFCDQKFDLAKELVDHTEFEHIRSMSVFCKNCDTRFARKQDYNLHLTLDVQAFKNIIAEGSDEGTVKPCVPKNNPLRRYCTDCDKTFNSRSGYESHMKRHRQENGSEPQELYICQFCGKTLLHSNSLATHINQQHSGVKFWRCHICRRMFKSKKLRDEHKAAVHLNNDRPFLCSICGKDFTGKGVLATHMLSHGDPKIPCDICGKLFHNRCTLRSHKITHDDEKRYRCQICGEAMKTKSSLNRHLKLHGTEMTLYCCDVCNRSYRTSSALKVHTRTHTGETPYRCPLCSQNFRASWQLLNHQRRYHSGEKPDIVVEDAGLQTEFNAVVVNPIDLNQDTTVIIAQF